MSSGVWAVIVTYNPDPGKLADLLDRLRDQVHEVVIVDNASAIPPPMVGVNLIRNDKNEGLAAALNRGVAFALEQGCSHVILFDQDSKPEPNMVAALRADLDALSASGKDVAIIGPSIVDIRNQAPLPFVRFGFPLNRKLAPAAEPVSCDFLITSGALIPAGALSEIGLMREGLFIDNIDMEWCARAKHKGFGVYGSSRARMLHELGDALLKLPLLNLTVAVHSPARLYYFMRNRVLLYRLPHVSRVWVAQDVLRIPAKFLIFSLFAPNRLRNMKYMLKGLWHGIKGIEGPIPQA